MGPSRFGVPQQETTQRSQRKGKIQIRRVWAEGGRERRAHAHKAHAFGSASSSRRTGPCRPEHGQGPVAVIYTLLRAQRRTLRNHLAKMRPAPGLTCAVRAGSPGSSSWCGRLLAAKGAGSEAAERGWRRRPSRREVADREDSGGRWWRGGCRVGDEARRGGSSEEGRGGVAGDGTQWKLCQGGRRTTWPCC